MTVKDTSHKDRVNKAIAFHKPDRTPRDFAAVPEIWKKLGDYFGTEDRNKTLEFLDVDCRISTHERDWQRFVSHFTFLYEHDIYDPVKNQFRVLIAGSYMKIEMHIYRIIRYR